jgi:hypothetical protein
MAKYKRQHFITRQYLREFSVNKLVYIYNGRDHKPIPYESQCQSDYFYSKRNAEEVESTFSQGENLLLSFIRNPKSYIGSELKMAMALTHVLEINLKNPRIKKNASLERYDAIKSLLYDYVVQIILDQEYRNQSLNEIFYELTIRWRLVILRIPDSLDRQFITCDSPSVIMTDSPGNSPCFVYLPIADRTAVYFTNKLRYFSDETIVELNENAIENLNKLIAVNAMKSIYSTHELTAEDQLLYKHGLEHDSFRSPDQIFLENGAIKVDSKPILLSNEVITELGF